MIIGNGIPFNCLAHLVNIRLRLYAFFFFLVEWHLTYYLFDLFFATVFIKRTGLQHHFLKLLGFKSLMSHTAKYE